MLLSNVALMPHAFSLISALGGLLAAEGRPAEPAYLMGVTGHAFRLTLDLVISPTAAVQLNFHDVFPLWEGLGAWFKRVAARPGDEGFAAARAEVAYRVEAALERGHPIILYDLLGTAEYGLVVGVEGDRWACLTPQNPTEPQWMDAASWPPAEHQTFTRAEAIMLLDMEPDYDRFRAEVRSLRFAVDHFWEPPSRDMWLQHGRQAYQYWQTVLGSTLPLHGPEPGMGHSYNLRLLHAARRDAAAYLGQLAQRYPQATSLKTAAEAYGRVGAELAAAVSLLPVPGAEVNERRQELTKLLERAQAAEAEGVGEIERALRALH